MADPEHLKILKRGVKVWNKWREENPKIIPDLRKANLREADLKNFNLRRTKFRKATLRRSDLKGAKLLKASLRGVDLRYADLSRADLRGATLNYALLVKTKLNFANLSGCKVHGISAWQLELAGTQQKSLKITTRSEHTITVDNLEVAQFLYLLLKNEKIRYVIDTITSKVVLILGRFTEERKAVLDAIRDELRKRDYLPVLFDFNKPVSRDLTETISTLAHMARFIIADITDAKSIPQELQTIVPNLPSVPVQPLLSNSAAEYGMFEHFRRYPWVLEICRYQDQDELIQSIQTKVIAPAEEMAKTLMEPKKR